MPIVFLAPDPIQSTQFIPGGNTPASGAQLFTYAAGTTTKQDVYSTNLGTVKWSNPIVLDSGGNLTGSREVWIVQGTPTKFVLAPFNDTDPPASPYWTMDNISGINDVSAVSATLEWQTGTVPTFISATSFSLLTDQTATYTVGRKVRTINTGGTVYSTISASSFGGGITTITVINDSGTIDAGISAIAYSNSSGSPDGSTPWTVVTSSGIRIQGSLNVVSSAIFIFPPLWCVW